MSAGVRPGQWLRLAAAVGMGLLLYQVLVVHLNGVLAALVVPKAYFAWFGKDRQALALALLQLAGAVPVALLVCGGVLAAHRAIGLRAPPLLVALAGGMLLCFAYWAARSLVVSPSGLPPGAEPYPLATRVAQLVLSHWWYLPAALAPWLGFGLAAWLLLRPGGRGAPQAGR